MDGEKDWLKLYGDVLGIDPELLVSPKAVALVQEVRRVRERRRRWGWAMRDSARQRDLDRITVLVQGLRAG
ncbi:hypothetical protein, partial [Bordetella bronchiseptica]